MAVTAQPIRQNHLVIVLLPETDGGQIEVRLVELPD